MTDAPAENMSLYEEVAEKLRRFIFEKLDSGGDFRLPSVRSLSESMGVSSITMRQAVQILVAEGMIAGRRGSGMYFSDEIVRGRETVAIVLGLRYPSHLMSPWVPSVYECICREFELRRWSTRNYTLFHGTPELDNFSMDQFIADARARKFAGVVSFPEFDCLRPNTRELLDNVGIKHLTFDALSTTNAVLTDYYMLGTLGTEQLYKKGARKVGLIGIPVDAPYSLGADFAGMLHTINAHPEMSYCVQWVHSINPSIEAGRKAFREIWSADDKPDGLLVSDEIAFIGVTMMMLELGLTAETAPKLVVHGSEAFTEESPFELVRVGFSPKQVAQLVAERLLSMVTTQTGRISTIRIAPFVLDSDAPL